MSAIDLSAPEVQSAIKEAVDAALAETSARIGDLSKENAKWRRLAQGKDGISQEDFDKIQSERDKLQSELSAAQKQAKDALKAAETATKQLEAETGFTQKLLIDNGLLETLGKNGVTDPAYQKAALAMLRGGVQIVIDGENRIAKFGDKPLADHVKEWATSDEGKRFVAADANTGGGAQGGSGSGNAKTMTRAQFDAADHVTRAKFAKEGGTVID